MVEQKPSKSATVYSTPLGTHGLDPTGSVHWNLSGDELRDMAVNRGEAIRTAHGALLATTGDRTGRSPNDRFIVNEAGLASQVHWSKVNRPISPAAFDHLLSITRNHLNSAETLFVKDMHCGADPQYAMPVRLVSESAWHSAFMHNMFIRSDRADLSEHTPEFTILHAPTMLADAKKDGVNSEVFVAISFSKGIVLIAGTRYAGEIKKSIFTIMNHILPARGLLPMHCSSNTSESGTALFFGLSGTGKTTLSADPERALVGDDEHGWSDHGVFNFEGGCYAKMINLSKKDEPAIYATTRMESTILENVILDADGIPNFYDSTLTQNTRASYPIESIENRTDDSTAGHPDNIVFLTCDAFGVLPPIARLSPAQAAYHFISGYTAKVAGTEIGITEPMATFSTCFGAPFMPRHPSEYADLLIKKIAKHNASCWLINTGWIAGGYGESSRIRIKWTRALLNAALSGALDDVVYVTDERFGFKIPATCDGVPSEILQPRSTWPSTERYDNVANVLVQMFNENFESFAEGCNEEVKSAAPRVYENQSL